MDHLEGNTVNPTLVIMAAGMGSRYGGLKQIDPVGPSGEIVLDYSVYDALQAGFGRVVFIIRPDIETEFKEAIGAKFSGRMPVEYAYQRLDDLPDGFRVPEGRVKPWGTAQAVLAAQDVVREPFCVLNADDFYGRESFEAIAATLRGWAPGDRSCCLVGFVLKNTLSDHGDVARGLCEVDDDGYLQRIVERLRIEKTDAGARYEEKGTWHGLTGDEDCSMNMWGFTTAIFPLIQERFATFLAAHGGEQKSEFLIPTVVDALMQEKELQVEVLHSAAKWLGVTYTADKPIVQAGIRELVNKGLYPEKLWA